MGQSPQEITLIENAQKGDPRAFEALIALYDQRVLGLLIQLLGNSEDAGDAYQEVFIRVWRGLDRFRFDADFFTWLYRIAVNTALSHRRRRQRHRHLSLEQAAMNDEGPVWEPQATGATPDRQLAGKEIGEKIEAALAGLALQQRAAFVLRHYESFKISEIAEIMNCTNGTVKNYLFRATRKLRLALKDFKS